MDQVVKRRVVQVWGGGGGGQRGQRWGGGCKGAKGQTLAGGGSCFFLQFDFRFRNMVGRTLPLRSFCITHILKAEVLTKFCTTGNENKVENNSF